MLPGGRTVSTQGSEQVGDPAFQAAFRAAARLSKTDPPGSAFAEHGGFALADRVEYPLDRPFCGVDLGDRLADHLGDVRVAAGGHRQVPFVREAFGLAVRAAGKEAGVIDFDRIGARENVRGDVGGNAVTGALEGMRDDCDPAALADALDRLLEGEAGGDVFGDPECEHVARGARDLDAGDADEAVGGCQLGGLQARADRVVVGDRKRVELNGGGLFEQQRNGIAAVVRQRGVTVKLGRKHVSDFHAGR